MSSILGYKRIQAVGALGVSGPPISVPIWSINGDYKAEACRIALPSSEKGFLSLSAPGSYFSTYRRIAQPSGAGINAPPQYMDITLSGLSGDLSQFNGTTRVEFRKARSPTLNLFMHALIWGDATSFPVLTVTWHTYGTNHWEVLAVAQSYCYKQWELNTSSPYGSYSENACDDSWCSDGNTCAGSSGATCSVSSV